MSNENQNDIPTDESGLRFYGIGIVTKDKPRNSDFIMVSPIEKISKVKGRLNEVQDVFEVESVDASGIVSKEKITGESHIKAKWFPLSEGNRQTAPDVREGETVRLWRYGSSNEFYWQTMYREPGIRRLETVLYCYGNLPKPGGMWNKESSYWHEVSTHDQHLWWKTTQSNGEAYSYDIKLDTKNSTYTVHDNVGNIFLIDSTNTLIRHINADGSFVDLNKKRYHGYAEEHMRHESKVIHMKTPLFVVTAKSDEGGYHGKAFVQVDFDKNIVEIGAGNDSYTHMDNGNTTVRATESIDEETKDKRLKSDTRDIEVRELTERYEKVTRETGWLKETTKHYERYGDGYSESLSSSNRDVGQSTEKYGTQDKTADTVKEKVGQQTSQVDKLEQTSQEQSIKSGTMKEEYEKQDVKVGERKEEATKIESKVTEKEDKAVGDYLLVSDKNIDLRSNEGILLTDTTASNLDVPGKIKLGDKDLGTTLQEMANKDGQMSSDIETLNDKVGDLDVELKKTNDVAKETNQNAEELKEKLNQTSQLLTDTDNRVSANEDEAAKLKAKVVKLEEDMVKVQETLVAYDLRFQKSEARIQELSVMLEETHQLAERALKRADEAYAKAEEAYAKAEEALAAARAAAAAAAGG